MLNVLKFYALINYKLALLMYKARNGCLFTNVQNDAVTENRKIVTKRSFQKSTQSHYKKAHCISVYGVKLYNNLNIEFISTKNMCRFKSQYKKEVFYMYSLQCLGCDLNL